VLAAGVRRQFFIPAFPNRLVDGNAEKRGAFKLVSSFRLRKVEADWGYSMRGFHPAACLAGKGINFLDATEEEVLDLVRSLVSELSIMTCFVTMPPEQKKVIRASIDSFEAYLGGQPAKH
jgi:hypothetical protein